MRLTVRHETRYDYGEGASGAVMRLRLMPTDCATQRVLDWRVTVNGEPVNHFQHNSFGVPESVWRAAQPIAQAVVVAEGVVETSDQAGILGKLPEAADARVFARQGDYTAPSEALVVLAAEARSAEGPLASLHNLCRLVHGRMAYVPDTTDSGTTAAKALEQGCGVCQDFAHVFLSCARLMDVPARYVAGYIFEPERPEEAHQSHGWAEAYVDGLGWVGFDPTHKVCVTDHYIRLSWGVDAFDAAPLRGVAQLTGSIAMDVGVCVAQAQQQ